MQNQKAKEIELLQQILKRIRFFGQKKNVNEFEENKVHILNELVQNTRELVTLRSEQLKKLGNESVINILRFYLVDKDKLIRQNIVKLFRYFMISRDILELYLRKNIHFFIARNLEREQSPPSEIIQSFKFIRQWIDVDAKSLPKLLVNSLIALVKAHDETIKKLSVETLRKLALSSPQMCAWSGGLKVLIEASVDPGFSDMNESLTYTLLYILNDPETRNQVGSHLDLTKYFSFFTEADTISDPRREKKEVSQKFELQINLAKKSIITMLKSWTGLIYLGHENTALRSLFQVLRFNVKAIVRTSIFDLIEELLQICLQQLQFNNPTLKNAQTNLVSYYVVILIKLLVKNELYDILLELSALEDKEIAGQAQRYIKELDYLISTFTPHEQQYPNYLLSANYQNGQQLFEYKSLANGIIQNMGNFLFENTFERKKTYHSKFLFQCENFYLTMQLGMPNYKISTEVVGRLKIQHQNQADDHLFQTLLRQTNIQNEKSWQKWNWQVILEIVETYLTDINRLNEAIKFKLIKKLLGFYQKTKGPFQELEWRYDNFIYVKVGYMLIKLLLKSKEGRAVLSTFSSESFFNINKSFLSDFSDLLNSDAFPDKYQGIDNSGDILSYENFSKKMIREYISWIGLFSMTNNGLELSETFKIWDPLFEWVNKNGNRDHLLSLVLFSLDYKSEGRPRQFLQYCLQNGSKFLIKSGLELLRLLYRSELADFSEWAIDILVTQLYAEEEISKQALDVLEEITQDQNYLKLFIKRCPSLGHLEREGNNSLIIRMLSTKEGYEYLTNLKEWTLNEINKWIEYKNIDYVEKVEKCLYDALDFGNFEDSQNTFKFGSLVQHSENTSLYLSFIHRLPWNMHIKFEKNDEVDEEINLNVFLEYLPSENILVLHGRPIYNSRELEQKTVIPSNGVFIIKLFIRIGKVLIDNTCREATSYSIRCDNNDKKHMATFVKGQHIIEKSGAIFVFDSYPDEDTIKLTEVKVFFKMHDFTKQAGRAPPHLYGELVKTKQGASLIKSLNHIDLFINQIKNHSTPLLSKRAALWAIAHIGKSKRGMQLLLETNAIQLIGNLVVESGYLSIKGTCLYVLNLIAINEVGRTELTKYGWITISNQFLNTALCLPQQFEEFISYDQHLVTPPQVEWAQQRSIWREYHEIIDELNLDEEQLKILQLIGNLSCTMIFKPNRDELSQIMSNDPHKFNDVELFYCAMLYLTFFNFIPGTRKIIYSLFDKIFNNPKIFLDFDKNSLLCKHVV